ncbi:MAG: translation elongation factor Ts [Pseudomonadota bacterium]
MTTITTDLIRQLRERSGAGMMDCKKALTEAGGDIEAAIDWLRTKGLAAAAKKAGRSAAEGLVGVHVEDGVGAVVEVNAETDFVGRNETFQNFVRKAAALSISSNSSIDQLNAMTDPESGRSISDEITHLIATVGENMVLRRCHTLQVSTGVVASYIHGTVASGLGRIGVLVALESSGDKTKLESVGRNIAMHIAATHPQALDVDGLDPQLIENERNVLTEQAKASGRPDNIIEKMVEGRLRKFYEQVVLLEQVYVVDNERKIRQVVQDSEKEVGAPITLKGFVRFGLGEGIEKKSTDFAEEVAAQLSS